MIYLVRHGRTKANADGLLLGRSDPCLDDLGKEQALRVAKSIGVVDRVISSPLSRTLQTAEAFRQPIEKDDRWMELDYGDFDGKEISDVGNETWNKWRSDLNWAPPGGESHLQLGERVRSACDELFGSIKPNSNVVVVSHVSPIKAAVSWCLGVDEKIAWRCFVDTASVTVILKGPSGPVLKSFNNTAHLDKQGV